MNYDYTAPTGVSYFVCGCGVTYPEGAFENGSCPDCE